MFLGVALILAVGVFFAVAFASKAVAGRFNWLEASWLALVAFIALVVIFVSVASR